ncbi:MAG: ABC transporter substrate-binding protein [Bacteroidota bacterium]
MEPAVFFDQLHCRVEVVQPVKRIVSLVPSQTELLFDLGLASRIAGVTRFCVHPREARGTKANVGGTKKFDFTQIDRLQPDLIIGNKEENYSEGIETLRQRYPVWMSDIYSLEDATAMMEQIGLLTGTLDTAQQLIAGINRAFAHLAPSPPATVLYLIWREPWMAAAKNTFIDAMLTRLGLLNVLAHEVRYPELSVEVMRALRPDWVFLSSEPYPFSQKHEPALRDLFPESKILLVDGEMFSWYGSRLLQAPAYFQSLPLR